MKDLYFDSFCFRVWHVHIHGAMIVTHTWKGAGRKNTFFCHLENGELSRKRNGPNKRFVGFLQYPFACTQSPEVMGDGCIK